MKFHINHDADTIEVWDTDSMDWRPVRQEEKIEAITELVISVYRRLNRLVAEGR